MSYIDYTGLSTSLFVTALGHPLSYVKVLMQLGHEPLPPVIRRNIFFRKRVQYPTGFTYLKHIKDTDGFLGLYRGLSYRFLANISTTVTYQVVQQQFGVAKTATADSSESNEDGAALAKRVAEKSCQETVAKCCAIVVSHPFHVIAIRSMAQFVGHEHYYDGLLSSVREIYEEEGILGFFVGLAPRLLAEVAQIWICNMLTHIVNNYALNGETDMSDLRQYTTAVTSFIASTLTYPISLTSNVMVVSGSRLAAGRPPNMACYEGWWQCLKDLRARGLSSRGTSLFFRPVIRYAVTATSVTPMPPPPIPK